jgi:hypothetical protein
MWKRGGLAARPVRLCLAASHPNFTDAPHFGVSLVSLNGIRALRFDGTEPGCTRLDPPVSTGFTLPVVIYLGSAWAPPRWPVRARAEHFSSRRWAFGRCSTTYEARSEQMVYQGIRHLRDAS